MRVNISFAFLTLPIFAIFLLLSGCSVALFTIAPSIVPEEVMLIHAGDYGKAIQIFESADGKLSPTQQKRIINDNINRIRNHRYVSSEFTTYHLYVSYYIRALIEKGEMDKALRVCDIALKESKMFGDLLIKYNYRIEATILGNRDNQAKLLRLKGYIIWYKMGRLDQARSYFNSALDKYKNYAVKENIGFLDISEKHLIETYIDCGIFEDKIAGNFEGAMTNYQAALKIVEKMSITNIDNKYRYLLPVYRRIQGVHMKLGHLEKAKHVLNEYQIETSKSIFKLGAAITSQNQVMRGLLSIMYSGAGALLGLSRDFETAKEYFDKAKDIVINIPIESDHLWDLKARGTYYVLYGTFYLGLQNHYAEAVKIVDDGISLLRPLYLDSLEDDVDIETAYNYSAELHYLNGSHDKAIEQSGRAIFYAKRYHNKLSQASSYVLQGQIFYKKNNKGKAKEAYESAYKLVKDVESTENWKLFYGLGQIYEDYGQTNNALKFYKKAVEEVEKLWKGRFQNTQKQVSFIDNRLVVYEPVIRILAKRGMNDECLNYMERSKARSFFESSIFFANISKTADPLTAGQIRRLIPDDGAIIEYYVGDKSVFGAAVTKKRISVREIKARPAWLQDAVMSFRDEIESKSAAYHQDGSLLYRTLIGPFEKDIKDKKILGIMPHGVLHYLPFQALVLNDYTGLKVDPELLKKEKFLIAMLPPSPGKPARGLAKKVRGIKFRKDEKTAHLSVRELGAELSSVQSAINAERVQRGMKAKPFFLIEKYRLFSAPSSTILNYARSVNSKRRQSVLALGSPPEAGIKDLNIRNPEGEMVDVLPKLPSAKTEVQEIGSLFDGRTIFTDENATETNFKANAQKSDVLVISAHGLLNRKDPMNSSIFLHKDSANNGRLTVIEVESLKLKANISALSACETGLVSGYEGVNEDVYNVKFPPGDDLVGFQRAFMKAGSASVLSTLWNVADEATAFWMVNFFKSYRQGSDKATAARHATLNILQANKNWEHPYYWAAFVLSGDWQ